MIYISSLQQLHIVAWKN